MSKELDFLDIISLASFFIAIQNLDLNVNQEDMNKQTHELTERLEKALEDIHGHLSVQDAKLNIILNKMEELYGNK